MAYGDRILVDDVLAALVGRTSSGESNMGTQLEIIRQRRRGGHADTPRMRRVVNTSGAFLGDWPEQDVGGVSPPKPPIRSDLRAPVRAAEDRLEGEANVLRCLSDLARVTGTSVTCDELISLHRDVPQPDRLHHRRPHAGAFPSRPRGPRPAPP
jgi:hypothetical protein